MLDEGLAADNAADVLDSAATIETAEATAEANTAELPDNACVRLPETDKAAAPESDPEAPAPDAETARLRDQLLRLQADFDNYRKRVIRDEAARARRATEGLVTELLPVLDHFELGLQAARDANTSESVCSGLELVHSQLLDALKKEGVTPVSTAAEPFDPKCHECIAHLPSPDHAENMIISETRSGWWLGDYLLRPARVIVSSGASAEEPACPAID